jgi:hypothetical protein
LATLAAFACLGLGLAGAQNDALFGAVFAVEAGLAFMDVLLATLMQTFLLRPKMTTRWSRM